MNSNLYDLNGVYDPNISPILFNSLILSGNIFTFKLFASIYVEFSPESYVIATLTLSNKLILDSVVLSIKCALSEKLKSMPTGFFVRINDDMSSTNISLY
jgi:hypothetical protein